ncbi:MAG TPA: hypothetical protein VHO24_05155 [Opitutaceae bacterium]|nr:hypothetical protein [Opitutaceae bacterium]
MAFRSSFYALVALVLFPPGSRAAEKWDQLKLGMSVEETLAALGQPLSRNTGRGFETWTYDKGGDALIYGSLIGWTAPASANVAVRSKDVWSENRNLPYLTFLSLLPPRIPFAPRRGNADASRSTTYYSEFYRR